jgi:hypothetical protein
MSVMSCNCRGFNVQKLSYTKLLLSETDILFLPDDQLLTESKFVYAGLETYPWSYLGDSVILSRCS